MLKLIKTALKVGAGLGAAGKIYSEGNKYIQAQQENPYWTEEWKDSNPDVQLANLIELNAKHGKEGWDLSAQPTFSDVWWPYNKQINKSLKKKENNKHNYQRKINSFQKGNFQKAYSSQSVLGWILELIKKLGQTRAFQYIKETPKLKKEYDRLYQNRFVQSQLKSKENTPQKRVLSTIFYPKIQSENREKRVKNSLNGPAIAASSGAPTNNFTNAINVSSILNMSPLTSLANNPKLQYNEGVSRPKSSSYTALDAQGNPVLDKTNNSVKNTIDIENLNYNTISDVYGKDASESVKSNVIEEMAEARNVINNPYSSKTPITSMLTAIENSANFANQAQSTAEILREWGKINPNKKDRIKYRDVWEAKDTSGPKYVQYARDYRSQEAKNAAYQKYKDYLKEMWEKAKTYEEPTVATYSNKEEDMVKTMQVD